MADPTTLAVAGVGLVGGSIGLAARERLGAVVRGYDASGEALDAALRRGAIDVACESPAEAVAGAEIAFAAVPVGALPATIDALLAAAGPGCAVSDVGSTKRAVIAGQRDERFIGGHPLAGAETAGVRHARADLFDGATWYLTPTATSSGVLYERLHRTIHALGAQPAAIEAAAHDAILAAVSHLPHVLANVLVAEAAGVLGGGDEDGPERLPASGPSFRDATRIAGANSAIWTDIYLSNRDALVPLLDGAARRLHEVRDALAAGDEAALRAWNDGAGDDRRRLLERRLAGGPVHELRVSVPNRPGVVAELALELGRAGVNISDMALYPTPDRSSGVVALWIDGDEAAARAQQLVARLGHPVAPA